MKILIISNNLRSLLLSNVFNKTIEFVRVNLMNFRLHNVVLSKLIDLRDY